MARTVSGLLGEKLGMTQVFDENNRVVPVTVVRAGPCVVTQVRTPGTDGYSAVQIAYGEVKPRRVTKPLLGHFRKAGVPPRRRLVELRTDDASSYALGQELTVELFEPGAKVDVVGRSKRKHRSPGSIGACATPARVFKGTRMAGRMGAVRTTTLNLTVHTVDAEQGLLLLKGSVPGPNGGLVLVRSAVKGGSDGARTGAA